VISSRDDRETGVMKHNPVFIGVYTGSEMAGCRVPSIARLLWCCDKPADLPRVETDVVNAHSRNVHLRLTDMIDPARLCAVAPSLDVVHRDQAW